MLRSIQRWWKGGECSFFFPTFTKSFPLVGYSGRILRSTSDLIDVMKTVTVNDDELLVNYDLKSLV